MERAIGELNVADRTVLEIEGNEPVIAALSAHWDYVGGETLTSRWGRPDRAPQFFSSSEHRLGSACWLIRLARDESTGAHVG